MSSKKYSANNGGMFRSKVQRAALVIACVCCLPIGALANASIFLNNNYSTATCSAGYCSSASVFGMLVGPGDSVQLNGGTYLNDIGLSTGANITTSNTTNIGSSTDASVVDFADQITSSPGPCNGNGNCRHGAGSSFSTDTVVWGGTSYNPTLVTDATREFNYMAGYWNSQTPTATATQTGNWNVESSGTGTHVYSATGWNTPTGSPLTIGCGINLAKACAPTDLIVILVPSGTVSIQSNINFAAGSGLTDDQLLFVIDQIPDSHNKLVLGINNQSTNSLTVHGDFFVINGNYTIGDGPTTIDGRVFANSTQSKYSTLVWNNGTTQSNEPYSGFETPEPGTWMLTIGALSGLVFWRRRKKTPTA
jgi:hypothetical protein